MEQIKIDAVLKGVSKLEFFSEQILAYLFKEKMGFKRIAEILAVFEMVKLYFRYQKFKSSSKKIRNVAKQLKTACFHPRKN